MLLYPVHPICKRPLWALAKKPALLLLSLLASSLLTAQRPSKDSIAALYEKAYHISKSNRYSEAEELAHQGLQLSIQTHDSLLMGHGYAALAEFSFYQHKLTEAEKYALKAEAFCTRNNDTAVCQKVHNLLGGLYGQNGEWERSLSAYENTLKLSKKGERNRIYYITLFNMGGTLTNMGQYERALKSMLTAKRYFEKQADTLNLATAYNNIGLLYHENLNEQEPAIRHFKRAARLDNAAGQHWNLSRDIYNLSLVFAENQEYDSSVFYLDSALVLKKEAGDEGGLAMVYNSMGNLNTKTGNYREAEGYYQKSQEIVKRYGIAEGLYHTNLGLGVVNDSMGRPAVAERHYLEALKATEVVKETVLLAEVYGQLYLHYKKSKNYKAALGAHEQMLRYQDSVAALKSDEALLGLKTRYETNLRENERALAQARQKQEQAAREQETFIKRVLILIAALLLLITITLLVAYRSRNKAYKVAKLQKNELEIVNARLQAKTEELNEINSAKDKLFSVISHDLRGPLASLDSCLEILITEELPEEDRNALIEDLRTETHNTLKTLDDLLSWSRIQIGGGMINKSGFDLDELIAEVKDLYLPLAKHKDIAVKYQAAAGPCHAHADPYQVRTVVRNLLSNAIKFTPPSGTVGIDTRLKNGRWHITVTDQGKGIGPEELEKIKAPDSYYSSRGTSGEKGTGVGLLLSFEFVERHGSQLEFEKLEPTGTRASFSVEEAPPSSSTT